ncbi:unnamed protein product [Enterobius vermicularis]|uniref:Transferred entry: 5.6.2.1 n=1 Tax=Enterobius vermicularis TaxID=51028 RepID=A0A0N4V4X5_ENTVE|nr:unnamed protein product [Enterobius vermicularis]
MLGLMNNVALDGGTADLYAAPKRQDESPVFEQVNKKPKVTYLKDGRKIVDGKVQEIQKSDCLWNSLLKRSVANQLQKNVKIAEGKMK